MSPKQDNIKIVTTQDGSHSLFSEAFGEQYHSRYGAIRESRHVFIQAGLYYKLAATETLDILEIGFGSGLNAFLTFLEVAERPRKIYYESWEAYPVSLNEVLQLNYPEQLQATDHKAVFDQMHRLPWGQQHELNANFTFQKVLNRFEELNETDKFDLVYFDAFAPGTQPELWEAPLLSKIHASLRSQGVFVTYSAKGSVKRNLKSIGFEVENLPGPPGKREMIRAFKI